jgi:DNA-binding IclR family transcriptional regulator
MHKEPASAKTLAQGLSLPVGTVLCHLTTLEDEGFVRQIGDCWVLGMALARIWARVKSREESRLQEAKRNLTELNLG